MNNRVLLAALAGGIVAFLLGWLIWGILLMDYLREINPQIEGLEKNPPEFVHLILANLVWGLLYALIFSLWAGISTFKEGLIAGAWLTALIALGYDLTFIAVSNMMSIPGAVVDVVASTVVGALTGGVVGWVLGYNRGG